MKTNPSQHPPMSRMDSTAAEDARNAKRARLITGLSSGEVVDRISGLGDDLLLRVLELVADTSDAVRTGALSRRWAGLWTRVPALRFVPRPAATGDGERAALERYISFVNGVLDRRRTQSDDYAIESLEISNTTANSAPRNLQEQLMQASAGAAQEWIRYSFQHGVKSLAVDLGVPPDRVDDHSDDECEHHSEDDEDEELSSRGKRKPPLVIIVQLLPFPCPERLETMRLALGGVGLQLPAATTMKFASLMDLSLEGVEIVAPGAAHLLARLVSSASCPRLQKLRIRKLRLPSCDDGEMMMKLDADVLSELWVEDVNVRSLELRAPSLRVLHIDLCCNEVLRVSAPRLEELAFFLLGHPPSRLEVDGDLAHVRSLKLYLMAHRYFYSDETTDNHTNILLLKHCSSATCLDVTLEGKKVTKRDVDMIQGSVPHLAHVTSLTVNVSDLFDRHNFGIGVASLLTRFKNLRQLSLHLPLFSSLLCIDAKLDLECDHPDHWTSNEISMAHLQEVELIGLTGTDCELWFMKAVLKSARGLRKVAISFNPKSSPYEGKMDALEHMLLDEGMWTSHRDEFMLNCCMNL